MLLRTAAEAWLQIDPDNAALKKLLRDLKYE